MQQHSLSYFSLSESYSLYDFNNSTVMFKLIIHYVKIKL